MMRMHAGWRSVCMVMALVAAFATFGQTPPPAENVIHVEISGLRSDKGQMLCALYSSAEAFPKKADKAVARLTANITPAKRFAISPESRPGPTRCRWCMTKTRMAS